MRVYYVGSGLAGCYLVRCLLPLQANGWDGDVTSINPTQKTPENKTNAAIHSDIVVFHRPESPDKLKLARHLKELGKKIVYDNDDTYKDDNSVKLNAYMTEERVKNGMKMIGGLADEFIKEADLVTCSTQFLADEYKKINPNVKVLPNMIDPFFFDEPLRNEGDKVRIGITGSVGLTSDLDVLFPIFKHYENDPRVQLVFFSLNREPSKLIREIYQGEYAILESFKSLEWVPLVPVDEYYETLNNLRLDFQIIPRQDNYFNRCKSNIKFLESSMLEIPVIAQGFSDGKSPYQGAEDSKHMLIANTFEDWIKHIEDLIANKDKRRAMGAKAREYVEENYDINKKAHLWEDAYNTLLDGRE
jgi:glycosyltransferase involved in cell wall biosynthesis